jgi:hypothetical protein
LKVPRYNGLPVDEPGKSGNIILNIQDNIFYGHDGFTWVPFGGTGTELVVARTFLNPAITINATPSSTADIFLPATPVQFANFTTPVFGTSPDIFPDFINPYISFPSLTGTDIELSNGVFEIDFCLTTIYNPTGGTVIYPALYIYDVTNATFVGKGYKNIDFLLGGQPPQTQIRDILRVQCVVEVSTPRIYQFYYGVFDPSITPTLILNSSNPSDTFITVKRLCDI